MALNVADFKAFLAMPVDSQFNLSNETAIATWLTPITTWCIKHYGLTAKTIPTIMKGFTDNGISLPLVFGIANNEGGNWTYLNHYNPKGGFPSDGNPYTPFDWSDGTKAAAAEGWKMKTIVNGTYPLASYSDYVTNQTGKDFLNSLPAGTIGRYYLCGTAAASEEACLFLANGSLAGTHSSPITNLYNWIKKQGGNPLMKNDGSHTDPTSPDDTPVSPQPDDHGGNPGVNTPTNNAGNFFYVRQGLTALAYGIGTNTKFIMNNNFMQINQSNIDDDSDKEGGGANDDGQVNPNPNDGDNGGGTVDPPNNPDSKKIHGDEIAKEAQSMIGHAEHIYYAMTRPVICGPDKSGPCDCSGFVCWCLKNSYPSLWNNGNTGSTATLYSYFNKQHKISWSGSFANLFNQTFENGDIVNLSIVSNFGTGGSSHVGVIVGNGNVDTVSFVNCESTGGRYPAIHGNEAYGNTLRYYLQKNEFTYACIIKA